ncbi:MATE family efflux transporter [Sporolactobacillus terrae]|uniref:Probable multidrug resistance protein NorM n=1 Tax=Sporolactobacillus terrae TaxID=269673 RepID=A0ABX5Q558_9BACL|nr:MATE family efflux transporter [Sporolactobacillus terrae]QAA21776.1 MATE family efflux transporter [Sporolactobacillus terrae]QAA24749.1 MATE family efflux transporter [Sporolactobacillus terrae]UAK16578.1 MATE family efflux transporter [Sporolactobacillus terrae]
MNETLKAHIKPLNQLAVPLIANSIFGLSIEFIDQAMVGHLSVSAYASVGAVGNFLYTVAGIFGAIAIVLNILGSRAMGEHREDKYLTTLSSSLLIDLLFGMLFGILCFSFGQVLLQTVYDFSGTTLHEGTSYLSLMSGYMLLQLLIFTLTNCLKIKKRTQWILIISTTTTLLHTGLNYLLIFGKFGFPQLGIAGAALSSTITLTMDVLAYCWLLRKDIRLALQSRPNKVRLIIRQSLPLMGQELLQGSLFVIVINAILAHLGTLVLSSYLLIGQLLQIGLIPAFMYSSALLTLVGESSGAHRLNDLKGYPKTASVLTMVLFSLTGIIFYLLRAPIAGFITNDPSLIGFSTAIFLLLWLANLFSPWFEVYKAAMQSIGKGTYVLIATLVVHAAALVIMALLAFPLHLGIYGIAASLFFDYFVMYVCLRIAYLHDVRQLKQTTAH